MRHRRYPGSGNRSQICPLINSGEMPDAPNHRKNLAPWWGLLFAIGAIGCNVAFFVSPSLQGALPWLSLLFAAFALIFLVIGLRRAFGRSQVYRGKTLSVLLSVVALLAVGITAFAFVSSRELPSSTSAPQVGQRVPDFTLSDISGKPVSLDQLLAPAASGSPAPQAVLLVFYRGYW
jgi:hypothetical protein